MCPENIARSWPIRYSDYRCQLHWHDARMPHFLHLYKVEETRRCLSMNTFKCGGLKCLKDGLPLDKLWQREHRNEMAECISGFALLAAINLFQRMSIIMSSSEKYWNIRKYNWPVACFLSKWVTMVTPIFHLFHIQYEWLILAVDTACGGFELRQSALLCFYTYILMIEFFKIYIVPERNEKPITDNKRVFNNSYATMVELYLIAHG